MIQLNDNNPRGASGSGHVSDIPEEDEDESEEILVKREFEDRPFHIQTQLKKDKGDLLYILTIEWVLGTALVIYLFFLFVFFWGGGSMRAKLPYLDDVIMAFWKIALVNIWG